MILAFDTYYYDDKAKTACVCFENWIDAEPLEVYTEVLEGIAAYEPGSFYKRELPCILSLLKQIDLSMITFIVIDGFVLLDDEGKLGLGGYLYEALNKVIPVIGVAKSSFHQNKKNVRELLRGESKKPLYVSAIGVEADVASRFIERMCGDYRMPDLLRVVDSLGRTIA